MIANEFSLTVTRHEVLSGEVHRTFLDISRSVYRYQPGQYLNIILRSGKACPFSIANAPNGTELELHIRQVEGSAVTDEIIAAIEQGTLKVSLAQGQCTVRQGERPILMIAGGTGIAPLKAMLEALEQQEDGRPRYLIWGSHQQEGLYLHNDFQQITAKTFHYIPTVEQVGVAGPFIVGNVFAGLTVPGRPLADFDIYIAGSFAMVFAVRDRLVEMGANSQTIYSDMLDLAGE
tara:strand:+ start:1042 stop:1740 length:699 start_codon:yes stop_codon:yes gene_type:complete